MSFSEEDYRNPDLFVSRLRKEFEEQGLTIYYINLDCGQKGNTSNGNFIQFSILALLFLLIN